MGTAGRAGRTRRCAGTSAMPATCCAAAQADAGRLHDPQRAQGRGAAPDLRRPGARIAELAEAEELAAIRPDLDGNQIMAVLGIGPGREVGQAYRWLLERRLDEGPLGAQSAPSGSCGMVARRVPAEATSVSAFRPRAEQGATPPPTPTAAGPDLPGSVVGVRFMWSTHLGRVDPELARKEPPCPGHSPGSAGISPGPALPHIVGLDGLRAVAVVAVVLYHAASSGSRAASSASTSSSCCPGSSSRRCS